MLGRRVWSRVGAVGVWAELESVGRMFVRMQAGIRPETLRHHQLRRKRVGPQPHPHPEGIRVYPSPATVVHGAGVVGGGGAGEAGSGAVVEERVFAVIALAGTQFRVCEGDRLIVPRLKGVEVGESVDLEEVMLVGSVARTLVGRPWVEGAKVRASVEEHTRGQKVLVFKKKRRKGYRKKQGFRQHLTVLSIDSITSAFDQHEWPLPKEFPSKEDGIAAVRAAAPANTPSRNPLPSEMAKAVRSEEQERG